jgi:hypothetical protein
MHICCIFKSIALKDLVSRADHPAIRPPSSSWRRSQGDPHISNTDHFPKRQHSPGGRRQKMQLQSSFWISWERCLCVQNPQHTSRHNARERELYSPTPRHISSFLVYTLCPATPPSSSHSVVKEHPTPTSIEVARKCGLGEDPRDYQDKGWPVGGDVWIPSSAAFRIDLVLRARDPQSPARCLVQHPSLALSSSSVCTSWQAPSCPQPPAQAIPLREARTPRKCAGARAHTQIHTQSRSQSFAKQGEQPYEQQGGNSSLSRTESLLIAHSEVFTWFEEYGWLLPESSKLVGNKDTLSF